MHVRAATHTLRPFAVWLRPSAATTLELCSFMQSTCNRVVWFLLVLLCPEVFGRAPNFHINFRKWSLRGFNWAVWTYRSVWERLTTSNFYDVNVVSILHLCRISEISIRIMFSFSATNHARPFFNPFLSISCPGATWVGMKGFNVNIFFIHFISFFCIL